MVRRAVKPLRKSSPRLRRVALVRSAASPCRGALRAGAVEIPCALGRFGLTRLKREGDGATPIGVYRLLGGYWRADRSPRLRFATTLAAIKPSLGWCDDPSSRSYNRPVRLPFAGGREKLWRDDCVYDVLLVLDYNVLPIVRGRGSAIFLHVARDDWSATEGCVAIRADALRRLLPRLAGDCRLSLCASAHRRSEDYCPRSRGLRRSPKIAVPIRTNVAPS